MSKPLLFAALAAVTLAATPAPAQSGTASDAERLERLERAVQQLQQRNTELEREVTDLKNKKSVGATTAVSTPTSAQAASTGKEVVETKPAKEEKKSAIVNAAGSEVKLTLGGFVQAQVEAGDVFSFEGRFANAAGEIKDRFRIRRARINVAGDFAEDFDFKLEGEFTQSDTAVTVRDPASGATLGTNSTRTSFSATDLFVNWHRLPEANFKVGQFKAPFGLEQLTPDTKLFTIERTLATTALTPERQIGVQLWGKPFASLWPDQKDLLTYSAGVFNGTGRNVTVNDNNEFMYVGRVEVQAVRSKILNNQELTVKFGADGVTSRDDTGTGISSSLRETSDGSLTSFSFLSPGQRDAYGVDAAVHLGAFDVVAEYLDERIRPRSVGGVAPRFAELHPAGYYVQGSYFLIPKKLQLVSKYESFDPDQFADDDIHSITGGVNYYLKGDEIKLLANYIHTWSDFRAHRATFEHDEFDEVIVRLQVMF
ncbi:MAG: porin [Chthoniobacterales bacterium]